MGAVYDRHRHENGSEQQTVAFEMMINWLNSRDLTKYQVYPARYIVWTSILGA